MDYLKQAAEYLNVVASHVDVGYAFTPSEIQEMQAMSDQLAKMRRQLIEQAITAGTDRAVIAQTFGLTAPRISQIKGEMK